MNKKLKQLREKRGLSQAEVAAEIGISRQMYNKYERGDTEPSLAVIKSLCTLYAISYEELIDSSEKESCLYNSVESFDNMTVSTPEVAYGTENYYAQILTLLPRLLLSEKSRLLTAVAQSMTEEVEGRKSQPMKVDQSKVYFPTEEEFKKNLNAFLESAKSSHFSSCGEKWTREEMHER